MSCCLWLTWALLLVVVSFGGSVCFCGEVGRAVAVHFANFGGLKSFFRTLLSRHFVDTVTALPCNCPFGTPGTPNPRGQRLQTPWHCSLSPVLV
jgi:hypothetical protein